VWAVHCTAKEGEGKGPVKDWVDSCLADADCWLPTG